MPTPGKVLGKAVMEPGTFYRKLRSLNPQLKIWCGNDDSKPAGLFIVKQNEFTEICGVDKQDIPEHTVFNEKGLIVKSGWRRTLRVLISQRLISEAKAEKVFKCVLDVNRRKVKKAVQDSPEDRLKKFSPMYGQFTRKDF